MAYAKQASRSLRKRAVCRGGGLLSRPFWLWALGPGGSPRIHAGEERFSAPKKIARVDAL